MNKKPKFNSIITPGVKQDASNYLVELAFLRANHGAPLQPKFWQQSKYKFRYRIEIQACRKFIKKYGEPNVIYIAMHNHITSWSDFAKVEFLLQQRNERAARLSKPKDTLPIRIEVSEPVVDLRINKITPKIKKGLFERLEEINYDN